jgi:hypothetical protein
MLAKRYQFLDQMQYQYRDRDHNSERRGHVEDEGDKVATLSESRAKQPMILSYRRTKSAPNPFKWQRMVEILV